MSTHVLGTENASGPAGGGRATFLAAWPAWLTAAAFLPLLLLHLADVWSRPHYEFVPMLLPGAGMLLWQRCRNLGVLTPGERPVAIAQCVLIWSLLAMSILFVSSWLGAVTALLAIPAAAYAIGGGRLAAAATPAAVLLALAIPPPFHLDYALVGWLQGFVSRCSGVFLDLLKIDHVMEGNVIDLGSRQLLVDQACSGVYSLFTLGAFTLFYLLWTRASFMHSALLIGSAVFWVIAGNVLRVVSIAVLATRFGIDATAGKKHTALGLAGFGLMVLMVLCTDRLVVFLRSVGRVIRHYTWGTKQEVAGASWRDLFFHWDEILERRQAHRLKRGLRWRRKLTRSTGEGDEPLDTDDTPESGRASRVARLPVGPTRLPELRKTWPGALAGGLAFAVLLLPQFRLPGMDWKAILADRGVEARAFSALDAETMPEQVAGLRRGGFSTETRDHDLTWGENSKTWSYLGSQGAVTVSLDFPFVGWHDLTDCYKGRGFRVASQRVIPASEGEGPVVVVDLSREDGRHARLVFGLFDREGRALLPPYDRDLLDVVRDRLASWGLTGSTTAESNGPTHQVQVLFGSAAPLIDEQVPDLLAVYRTTVAAVRKYPLTKDRGPRS